MVILNQVQINNTIMILKTLTIIITLLKMGLVVEKKPKQENLIEGNHKPINGIRKKVLLVGIDQTQLIEYRKERTLEKKLLIMK
ncbi:hypothetical protein D3C85_1577920 [compost metagenome]